MDANETDVAPVIDDGSSAGMPTVTAKPAPHAYAFLAMNFRLAPTCATAHRVHGCAPVTNDFCFSTYHCNRPRLRVTHT
jgi:hypothetical protein